MKNDFSLKNHSHCPGAGDQNGEEVNGDHFVKFEKLIVDGSEGEGGNKEETGEGVTDEAVQKGIKFFRDH